MASVSQGQARVRIWLMPLASGAPIELTSEMTLVGRQDQCDLKIDHKTISKVHCVLLRGDGALVLRDLGSTNGCRINGQKKQKGALLPNDVLTIAVFDFRVHIGDDLPPAVRPAGDRTEMIDIADLSPLDDLPPRRLEHGEPRRDTHRESDRPERRDHKDRRDHTEKSDRPLR